MLGNQTLVLFKSGLRARSPRPQGKLLCMVGSKEKFSCVFFSIKMPIKIRVVYFSATDHIFHLTVGWDKINTQHVFQNYVHILDFKFS